MGPFLEGDEVFAVCEITEDDSPSVQIEDSSGGKVIEGDVYLASCHVDANPEGDIAWTDFNDDIISHDQKLIIINSKRSESGRYTCHANNTYFNGQTGYGNSSIFMDVQYPPDVSIQDNSKGRVIQGDTFTADCVADSNPEADYKWTFPDGRLSTSSQLEIPSALKSDSGNYTCEVNTTFWDGTQGKASTRLYLDVQYEPVITPINYGPISPTGQVIVNSSIAVLCDVMESNPAVDVVLWGQGGDWLNFTSVTRDDHGTYNCTAMNTFWDNTPGSTMLPIFLDVQYNPEIAFSDVDNFGLEGRPFTKHCEVSAYHNWTKGGAVVSTDFNYVIEHVKRSDAGVYRCTASSEFYDGTLGTGYNETEVNVEYIPDVSVEKADWMIKEGEQVTFTCTVDSNPEVTYHNWMKDGAVVSSDLSHAIANVQRQDAGTYQCIAGNVFYDGTTGMGSSVTNLTVQYFPDVEVDKKTVTVKEGKMQL
ncbi:B-cell receptor CD22-like [Ptychodera flava]|uniref:B-cell receptor CD22-like n=1 Tax=Ptychodera flava TaxID=63121 RepID=UPI00396A72DE